jgi:hypothetical protein
MFRSPSLLPGNLRHISAWISVLALLSPCFASAQQSSLVHGLWVWKGPSILADTRAAESLRDFCRTQGINEVYLSVSERGQMMADANMSRLIELLHPANIRVEALLSSDNADEGGKHLEKLIDRVRLILQFNEHHPRQRFDGIHLDIEPQQRPENKGPGNLRFLPGLVDAYHAVRSAAEPAGLTVNADIQNKLLKGNPQQRSMLLSALPRVTLMLYELSSPSDGDSVETKTEKLRAASQKFLAMAYEGLPDTRLAKMAIALRTPDYGDLLPTMLRSLDSANDSNPHYLGWARHSYNDASPPTLTVALLAADAPGNPTHRMQLTNSPFSHRRHPEQREGSPSSIPAFCPRTLRALRDASAFSVVNRLPSVFASKPTKKPSS